MSKKIGGFAMLVAMLFTTPAPAILTSCPSVARQVARMKFIRKMDGGIDIYQGTSFPWRQGLPPRGITRGAQIHDSILISAGREILKMDADSVIWSNIDLDGGGRKELVVIINFLHGHTPGYYNLTSFYVFCPFSDVVRLCGEAGFSNPPYFNSVLPSGARVPVSNIPVSDYKVDHRSD